jgi:hypothetical protein
MKEAAGAAIPEETSKHYPTVDSLERITLQSDPSAHCLIGMNME